MEGARRIALASERRVAAAVGIHLRSTADQIRFVLARRALAKAGGGQEGAGAKAEALRQLDALRGILLSEIGSARKLLYILRDDSRVGFEASNHYYYLPGDLAEKILSCRQLLEDWIAPERERWEK